MLGQVRRVSTTIRNFQIVRAVDQSSEIDLGPSGARFRMSPLLKDPPAAFVNPVSAVLGETIQPQRRSAAGQNPPAICVRRRHPDSNKQQTFPTSRNIPAPTCQDRLQWQNKLRATDWHRCAEQIVESKLPPCAVHTARIVRVMYIEMAGSSSQAEAEQSWSTYVHGSLINSKSRHEPVMSSL